VGTANRSLFRTVLVAWLPVAVVATGSQAATTYATKQEVTRRSAVDAPAQLAQRAAVTLRGAVDLATDLGPFTAVFDGVSHVLPGAVLAEARRRGVDRVTWQPRAGVRLPARCLGTRPPSRVSWGLGQAFGPQNGERIS
jgi:hypothetical protein